MVDIPEGIAEILAYWSPTGKASYTSTEPTNKGKSGRNRRAHKAATKWRGIVYARDDHRCVYCGSPENLTLDHVIPVANGGISCWYNLVTSCASCNVDKGDKATTHPRLEIVSRG